MRGLTPAEAADLAFMSRPDAGSVVDYATEGEAERMHWLLAQGRVFMRVEQDELGEILSFTITDQGKRALELYLRLRAMGLAA